MEEARKPGGDAQTAPASDAAPVLIIESYAEPYYLISSKLFPGEAFVPLSVPTEPRPELGGFYYTRKEIAREIGYYFARIYYFEAGRIVYLDKASRRIRYYDKETGRPIAFEAGRPAAPPPREKIEALPHLQAQRGDHVIFPDQDEDDEEI